MSRKSDLPLLKKKSIEDINRLVKRFDEFESAIPVKYYLLRWVSSMLVVELHAIWERYAENRLIIALNHYPSFYIEENEIKGITKIPKGLSRIIVKGNSKFFDFRSVGELIDKGSKLLEKKNPFLALKKTDDLKYLETISAIRNYIVHQSDVSLKSYKKYLSESFSVKAAPAPEEFLNAIDNRPTSPSRGKKRIYVLANIVKAVIAKT